MSLLVSYNLACKMNNPKFYEQADIIRLNSPWYTFSELEEILKYNTKPKFLDINIKEREKPVLSKHKYEELLQLAGKYNVDWVGISNVEDNSQLSKIKELLGNSTTKICAKIETLKGCVNIGSLITEFDGIMVDVEDLSSEIGWDEAIKWKNLIYEKCVEENRDHFVLSGVIFEYKKMKQKFAYTYGAFDLLHIGHLKMLEKAKSLCDYLIVGVVDDESIRILKGKDRPIEPLEDRLRKVSSLKCVDLAVKQDGYDPTKNLQKYKSVSILVKGDDWEKIPGEDFIKERGGILITPPYTKGWSTSGIIKKIRDSKP